MWKSQPALQWPPWTLSLANCSYSLFEETRNAKKFEFTTNNIGLIGIYILGIFHLLRRIFRLLKIEVINLSWLYLGRWPENSPIPSTRWICSKWNSELCRSHACARNVADTHLRCAASRLVYASHALDPREWPPYSATECGISLSCLLLLFCKPS